MKKSIVNITLTSQGDKYCVIDCSSAFIDWGYVMTLFEKLKHDRIEALREGDVVKRGVISVIIAEASRKTKEPDDKEIITVVKKTIDNINYNLDLAADSDVIEGLCVEKGILSKYLPVQLTEDELKSEIEKIIASFDGKCTIKEIMPVLKSKFNGQYDGKLASTIIVKLV